MAKTPAKHKAPAGELSNFAYEASVVPTSFILEGVTRPTEGKPNGEAVPVKLMLTTALGSDSSAQATEDKINSPNPQKVDVALLPLNCETLRISGGLRITAGSRRPFTCNLPDFDAKMRDFVAAYGRRGGFAVQATRIVWCMAEGGWAWKNRETTMSRRVLVTTPGQGDGWGFDVEKLLARNSQTFPGLAALEAAQRPGSRPVGELIDLIAAALAGTRSFLFLKLVFEGEGLPLMPLYPSQEFVVGEAKRKEDDVSRVLAGIPLGSRVNQTSATDLARADRIACLHPQKVGNALRRYDEWYDDKLEHGVLPIEVYGYVKRVATHVRRKGSDLCFYDLLASMKEGDSPLFKHVTEGQDAFAIEGKLPDRDAQAHYFVGVLMRGGVFGLKKKEKPEKAEEAEDVPA